MSKKLKTQEFTFNETQKVWKKKGNWFAINIYPNEFDKTFGSIHSQLRLASYSNCFTDFWNKLIGWFLYDGNLSVNWLNGLMKYVKLIIQVLLDA